VDFSGVTNDTALQVNKQINYILGLNISPADKQIRIAKVVSQIGSYYHNQLYGAASYVFDSAVIKSVGFTNPNNQIEKLANKIVRNYGLSRPTARLIESYYNSVLGRAESEAFQNAISMQKYPTLTRKLTGKEDCDMCEAVAGVHTNPDPKLFLRHTDCDCTFIVGGYNTRNGILENYNKKDKKRNNIGD